MKSLFFPKITRRKNYSIKRDGETYHYAHYREQIEHDCKNRCVYCDVVINEIGFEGFALDHFRPQEAFPELANAPENLVTACGKCNRLKSHHWPIDRTLAISHDGVVGFVDPFGCDRHDFFSISNDGKLIESQGPSKYLIELLNLNRPSRILIRRTRLLQKKIDDLIETAKRMVNETIVLLENKQNPQDALLILKKAQSAMEKIQSIKKSIGQ